MRVTYPLFSVSWRRLLTLLKLAPDPLPMAAAPLERTRSDEDADPAF